MSGQWLELVVLHWRFTMQKKFDEDPDDRNA